ncbi:Uncharacterized protein dnm_099020 [Desulfonema magnum]|uniref:Uncharacterized protein n=1 Tax=Desulfonema magnum TaxID=45655 RepID=A0A975GU48_9BACT|nr:Uncharacterized protein dnm_099020 [Desulfonema magnum]
MANIGTSPVLEHHQRIIVLVSYLPRKLQLSDLPILLFLRRTSPV